MSCREQLDQGSRKHLHNALLQWTRGVKRSVILMSLAQSYFETQYFNRLMFGSTEYIIWIGGRVLIKTTFKENIVGFLSFIAFRGAEKLQNVTLSMLFRPPELGKAAACGLCSGITNLLGFHKQLLGFS